MIQSLEDFEKAAEDRKFMCTVVQGAGEIDEGKGIGLPEVKGRHGL